MTTAMSSQRKQQCFRRSSIIMIRDNIESFESQSSIFKTRKLTDVVNRLAGQFL